MSAAQIEEAMKFDVGRIVAVQNRYSLMHRNDDAEVLPLCRRMGLGYIPFFPLESGLLTGKYREGAPAPEGARLAGSDDGSVSVERIRQVAELKNFAEVRSRTMLELAASASGTGS